MFNSTACYCIGVKGLIDANGSERFSGMDINNRATGDISPLTALVGTLGDQIYKGYVLPM